jgi:uncharacterized protein
MNALITVIPADKVSKEYKAEAKTWGKWDSKNRKTFPFNYATEERVLILEGQAEITPHGCDDGDGGGVVTIGKGDAVTFHKGLKCKWKITKRMKKHYIVDDVAHDEDDQGAAEAITCDVCDKGCVAESYFMADDEQDICPMCYEKDRETYPNAEHQKDGKKWFEPDDEVKPKKKRKTKK